MSLIIEYVRRRIYLLQSKKKRAELGIHFILVSCGDLFHSNFSSEDEGEGPFVNEQFEFLKQQQQQQQHQDSEASPIVDIGFEAASSDEPISPSSLKHPEVILKSALGAEPSVEVIGGAFLLERANSTSPSRQPGENQSRQLKENISVLRKHFAHRRTFYESATKAVST